jgi:hypothetical protein
MSAAIPLLLLYAFMIWQGTTYPFLPTVQVLSSRDWRKMRKIWVRVDGLHIDNWTKNLPNTKQHWCSLHCDVTFWAYLTDVPPGLIFKSPRSAHRVHLYPLYGSQNNGYFHTQHYIICFRLSLRSRDHFSPSVIKYQRLNYRSLLTASLNKLQD